MEKINLHFTGDFHAVTSANNMIAALLDNYIYMHREEGFALKEVLWKRVLDINDRNLRFIVTGLGAKTDGVTMESGFDITPASEIMAILCLAKDIDDLRRRIGNIILGITIDGKPFRVKDMGVAGAITVLLLDAIKPNLVQTTEQTPAFVHGGPFANIAHGCNTVIATRMAMTYGDYVVTEAGFGADLGAEKFFNIKCRKSGLQPKLTVIVATTQGLKMHGGVPVERIKEPDMEGLVKGCENLDRHIRNMQSFGQSVVVAFNRYATDTDEELALVRKHCEEQGVGFAINNAFLQGGEGATELAQLVVDTIEKKPSSLSPSPYEDTDAIKTKIEKVAKNIYGAATVTSQPNWLVAERSRSCDIQEDWLWTPLPCLHCQDAVLLLCRQEPLRMPHGLQRTHPRPGHQFWFRDDCGHCRRHHAYARTVEVATGRAHRHCERRNRRTLIRERTFLPAA